MVQFCSATPERSPPPRRSIIIPPFTNHAIGMYERDHPYHHIVRGEYEKVEMWPVPQVTHEAEVRPDGYYGISKAYGEAMGRHYSEQFGISVICLRIGTVNDWDSPVRNIRHFATWFSHRDQARQIRRSLEAPVDVTYDIFYGSPTTVGGSGISSMAGR